MNSSIASQPVAQLGGPVSILSRQRADHIALDALLGEIERTGGEEQLLALQHLGRLVFTHAFAEETVLWPLARRVLADGESLTGEVEDEHQQVNELWTRLEGSADDASRRAELLPALFATLRRDVREEEDELLPALQDRLSPAQLRIAGVAWELTRRVAPTRPHPTVSRRPPGNVLSALPLSLIDRTRDRLDRLALRGPTMLRPMARALSASAARLSGAVERLPAIRGGAVGRAPAPA
jgi:hypothetical protein